MTFAGDESCGKIPTALGKPTGAPVAHRGARRWSLAVSHGNTSRGGDREIFALLQRKLTVVFAVHALEFPDVFVGAHEFSQRHGNLFVLEIELVDAAPIWRRLLSTALSTWARSSGLSVAARLSPLMI